MEKTISFEIRKQYKSLRNSEKKVADVILSSDFDVVNSSIEGLARRAGVSQPTIIRFANALGFKGFKDIKKALTLEKTQKESKTELAQVVSFPISPQDKLIDTPAKVVTTHIKHMQDMLKNLSSYELIRAVESIVQAKTIMIFAVENSCCVADDLKTKLVYMGFHVIFNNDPYLQKVGAKCLTEHDVAIGVTYSGTSKVTVDALATAKQAGATTICITNTEKTLINKFSDMSLCSGNEQYLYGNAIFSRCTQIALIDMIYTGILITDYEKYSYNIENNSKEIEEFGYEEE